MTIIAIVRFFAAVCRLSQAGIRNELGCEDSLDYAGDVARRRLGSASLG